jgi:hypothetical protein
VEGLPGTDWQQWMCAAISGVVNPKNDARICIVSAVGSSTTVTLPAPGELLGGVSLAPERMPPKAIGIAWAAGAGSISAGRYNGERDILHFNSPRVDVKAPL